MKIAAIIPAAGKGIRLKTKIPKPLVALDRSPLLVHTLRNLKKSYDFDEVIVAVDPFLKDKIERLLRRARLTKVRVVCGGGTRAQSVRNALAAVSENCDWVLIHDAARPLVSRALVRRTIAAARVSGAALCALPATATVKKIDLKKKVVASTEDRACLYLAQTPQVFKKKLLIQRHRALGARARNLTDDAAFFDGTHVPVKVVLGDPRNIKITTPDDVELFKFYLKKQ